MLTIILLSIAALIVAGLATLVAKRRIPRLVADVRGIALQTVIVMVVLIAIAGGVATVLLSTGQEATDNLEKTQIGPVAASYLSEALCSAAGFSWATAGGVGPCS